MIIPVRCFTCGKLLADKWEYYAEEAKKIDDKAAQGEQTSEPRHKNMEPGFKGPLLDRMGLDRICCRRHMISHVELIDRV